MRVNQAQIDSEVRTLRRYLRRPKTLEVVAQAFGWSIRTAQRRVLEVGNVWRVSPAGGRTCSYVHMPHWARQ